MTKTTKTNELTIKVHMVANDHGESIRMVRIPADTHMIPVVPVLPGRNDVLDAVFMYGQNDFQPIEMTCSVSVGDVIELDGDLFIVMDMGFKEMTREELEEYKAIDQDDRSWSKWVRPEYAARMAAKETN